jgi:hypothetical protein
MPSVEEAVNNLMREANEKQWKEAGLFEKTYFKKPELSTGGKYSSGSIPINANTINLSNTLPHSPGLLSHSLSFRQSSEGVSATRDKSVSGIVPFLLRPVQKGSFPGPHSHLSRRQW